MDSLLSIIAPHDCLVCGQEGSLVCTWCAVDSFGRLPSRCYRCRRLTTDFAVCDTCRRHSPLRHVWVRTPYQDTAKELLERYKYERTRAASRPITELLQEAAPYLSATTLIIPVPTASSRIRERGYDHAAILARLLACSRGLDWASVLSHLSQVRQVGADRRQRLSQLQNAIIVRRPPLVQDRDILLIDDVVTTGASLEVAAKALKKAGAKSINALVFAQKQ